MSEHAVLSPSGAERWFACPGSVVLEAPYPRVDNEYSAEGTAAHFIASVCLNEKTDALAYLGRLIQIGEYEIEVTEEMAGNVQIYVDNIRQYSEGGELFVEVRVPIGRVTGEQDAAGTSDAVIIIGDELQVHDLKYGRGVAVQPDNNPQLMIYALGALEKYGAAYDIQRVRLVIHQPRVQAAPLEWDTTPEALALFAGYVKDKAAECDKARGCTTEQQLAPFLNPGEKQCRFCLAKASCPALAGQVQKTVGADFEKIAQGNVTAEAAVAHEVSRKPDFLPKAMAAVDLIEDWCKAVRAEVERRLAAGQPVLGYKLVEGKRGNRDWSDVKQVEETLRKRFRLSIEEAFNLKLKSPTQVEKLLKESPKRWEQLLPLITQSPGKPHVAEASDKRPALSVANDFDAGVDDLI